MSELVMMPRVEAKEFVSTRALQKAYQSLPDPSIAFGFPALACDASSRRGVNTSCGALGP